MPTPDAKLAALARAALAALSTPSAASRSAVTSNLTIDETLLLHGAGYEPVDLVTGVSVQSIPFGTFYIPYGQGTPVELPTASDATMAAFSGAADELRRECARAGGIGIVGVEVDVHVAPQHVRVSLVGSAIRPIDGPPPVGRPFATDLGARDFVLLGRAGWVPLDLVYGASFVGSPIQGMRQVLAQMSQNVELVQLTQALQDAREQAMERMQSLGIAASGSGVVNVTVEDGPLGHSRHVVAFLAYGTAVRLGAQTHQRIEPKLVLSVDDHSGVEAAALRTRRR